MRLIAILAAVTAVTGAGCTWGPPTARWAEVGRSSQGRPIRKLAVGGGDSVTLIFGAFHGDEPESAELARRFAEYLWHHPEEAKGRNVVIVPEVNPDGLAAGTRTNAAGVDINRNMAVSSWLPRERKTATYSGDLPTSEPEARVVMRLMERLRPDVVVSIHSIRGGKQCVNYDGPGRDLAERMSKRCGYPVTGAIGYPTPGSFGAYSGHELGTPTITLELPRGVGADEAWSRCRGALMEAVKWRPAFPVNRRRRPVALEERTLGR